MGSATRHRFVAGTTLNPGKAIVVFAGASAIPAGLSNATPASTGGLSLGNSGDTVTLRDSGAVVKNSISYSSAGEGRSFDEPQSGRDGLNRFRGAYEHLIS